MVVSVFQFQMFFLVLTRIMALIIQVPMMGGRQIPNQVKIGFGILLSVVLIPWELAPVDFPEMPTFGFSLAVARELLIGTLAGFAISLTFSAFEIAGGVIGIGTGFGSSNILNPLLNQSGSAIGQFFFMIAALVFIATNSHHMFIIGLQRTFEILPVNQLLPYFTVDTVLLMAAQLIVTGVQMAMPVFATLLLTDLTLALLAKVAPTIHVFFLGVPLKIGIGLVTFSLSMVYMIPRITIVFEGMPERILELIAY